MRQNKRRTAGSLIGLLSALCLVFASLAALQERSPDVPYVPTPEMVVEAMLAMAEVNQDDVLYDLGCGDGRIVITAAKTYGSRGVGIDIDPQRIEECHENASLAGVEDKVEFFQTDLFTADFSEASVMALYLLTEVNRKLRPKFLKELSPGTRIVSHDFDMGRWKADKEILLEDEWEIHSVYLWIISANVTGKWTTSVPDDSGSNTFTINFEQSFQYVSGEAIENNLSTPITGGQLTGDTLVFSLEKNRSGSRVKMMFQGRVDGHSIVGTVKTEGLEDAKRWEAERDPSTQIPLDTPVKDFIILNQ